MKLETCKDFFKDHQSWIWKSCNVVIFQCGLKNSGWNSSHLQQGLMFYALNHKTKEIKNIESTSCCTAHERSSSSL